MLIACITGPDFETAKTEIEIANLFCQGIELRTDLLACDVESLIQFAKGIVFKTGADLQITSKHLKISTYHNFQETPHDLQTILEHMPRADIYKIATFANSSTDALRMLHFTKRHTNVAGICMGPLGAITRILAPVVGSPLNFTYVQRSTGPGQVQLDELIDVYGYPLLSPKTALYGLIGHPIEKSPSHVTHNAFFRKHKQNSVYVKMDVLEEELASFLRWAAQLPFQGLSVTMPHKEKVGTHLEFIEPEAKAIGAVNTLVFTGKWQGANTDGIGALDALEENIFGKKIALLGEGGSAKAIAFEAGKRGADITFYSRRRGNLASFIEATIVINTTPIAEPVSFAQFLHLETFMDITMGHENSSLMRQARQKGCRVIEASAMFHQQAKGQFARWDRTPSF